jgi:hypothetical protein
MYLFTFFIFPNINHIEQSIRIISGGRLMVREYRGVCWFFNTRRLFLKAPRTNEQTIWLLLGVRAAVQPNLYHLLFFINVSTR